MSIKITEKSYDKELFNSRLELEITGKNVDFAFVNTLRRIIVSEIPCLSYQNIEITENTSVFNNNQIKLYLQNIPVIGVKNVPKKYKKKKEVEAEEEDEDLNELIGNNEAEIDNEIKKGELEETSLENMTLYLEYHNNTAEIKSVTTDHAKFYYMGKEVKSPYVNPVIIIKLQQNQRIKLTAKSILGIEKENATFSQVSVCAYNEIDPNKFLFFIESRGQIDEYELLKRGCNIIKRKLDKLSKVFPDINMKQGEIKIPQNKHTMGNLISHGLSLQEDTNYATYYQKHSLDNEIFIKFGFKKEINVKKIINSVCDYYNKLFSELENKL